MPVQNKDPKPFNKEDLQADEADDQKKIGETLGRMLNNYQRDSSQVYRNWGKKGKNKAPELTDQPISREQVKEGPHP